MNPPAASGRVLPTLNEDGSRRWLRPKLSHGRFLIARRAIGWLLIVLFISLPLIRIGDKPSLLFDVIRREFTFFGTTFLPTDSFLLMLLMLSIFLGIFWLTALLGRVWCGWGCPQTVYMEFLFRPLERLIEGSPHRQRQIDNSGFLHPRRILKWLIFAIIAFGLANVFLAYFVGVDTLELWVLSAPTEHPGGFSVVLVVFALVFIDFAFFREQMCTVVCPYARLQSVLLDGESLIVGYDALRGEARAKAKERKAAPDTQHGDCIDCGLCVATCPTGIDIREGLQLECITCAQCIDACDHVMAKLGKPLGLIRYSAQKTLQTGLKSRILRPRVVIYPILIAILLGALALTINLKGSADITLLRAIATPFEELPNDQIRNTFRVKIVDRTRKDARHFTVSSPDLPHGALFVPQNPVTVPAGQDVTLPLFVTLPRSAFVDGRKDITLQIEAEDGFVTTQTFRLLGPKKETP